MNDIKEKYVYVLDCSDNTISEILIDSNSDIYEVFNELGFKESNCSWMISNNRLDINHYIEHKLNKKQ